MSSHKAETAVEVNSGAIDDGSKSLDENSGRGMHGPHGMASLRSIRTLIENEEVNEKARSWCCVNGVESHSIPLLLALVAFTFTFSGSFACSYFHGATISFTGDNYGLWTLEDKTGTCRPWDVLFYSYSLGPYLSAARGLSMTAIVLGLSLLTAMAQAHKCHFVSWFIGVGFFGLFIASLATNQTFNVWTVFFFFLYIILVLIVRSLFIHPVHRAISWRGRKYIAWLLILCFVLSTLTLLVLNSDFCQCTRLTDEKLEGRVDDDPFQDRCDQRCALGPAGVVMVIGSAFWLLSGIAVLKFGVQPEDFVTEQSSMYGGFSKESITTKVLTNAERLKLEAVQLGKKTTEYVRKSTSASLHMSNAMNAGTDGSGASPEVGISALEATDKDPVELEMNAGPDDSGASPDVGSSALEATDKDPAELEEAAAAAAAVASAQKAVSDDEEEEFHRTCCQKVCCDFRVTERSRKEKVVFWCFRFFLVALYVIFGFAVVMMIGSRTENGEAERAPETFPSFITNVTCAFNASDPEAPFVTYETPQAAAADNMTVAHCGPCSHCSNMADIETYVTTRETITIEAKKCGKIAVLGSREDLDSCVEERIGFSDECRSCWVDNMQCDADKCLFTCMKTLFTGFLVHNNVPISGDEGRLNWCLQCDEKRCGTAFVTCSGVARRRLRIASAIERNPRELCPYVDVDWDTYAFETEL